MTDSSALLLFSATMVLCSYFKKCKRPTVHVGNPNNHALLAACPTLSKVFWASPFCWNEHVQLMLFVYSPFRPSFQWRREIIVLSDGERLALDWVCSPRSSTDNGNGDDDIAFSGELTESSKDTPILMLHHGSTCDSYDLPSQDYIRPALERGWIVCALNRRGHALPLTRPKANFFGCCDDLHEVSQQLLKKRPNAKLLTIGISAGSALVARHFGKDATFNDFTAGVAIAPGYDVSIAMSRVAWPYASVMLKSVKHFFQHSNQHLFESKATPPGYDKAMKAETFQEWLDHSYGLAGYESKEEYYFHSNPMNYVYDVPESKPLMAINAEDDPICVKQNIDETVENFRKHKGWYESGATLVTSKSGSHCPFYEGVRMNCWAEKLAFEFLDAALARARATDQQRETQYR